MTRLDVLREGLEVIRSLRTLSFAIKGEAISYYKNEIRAIEEFGANNPEYDEGEADDRKTAEND